MKNKSASFFSLAHVEAARRRIASGLRVTPCHVSAPLSRMTGMEIWLKRDDLQRTGSFKERGARHALSCLTARQRRAGVVAASAGNHALGLAFHGGQLGVPVTVVVPESAPAVKITRCRALGATVLVHGRTFDEAQRHAASFARESGATPVHPFDDYAVMAGQGTLALEVLDQVREFDTLVVPVGGGGLLAGVTTALKGVRPDVRVVAVEPAHAAGFLAAQLSGGPTHGPLAPTLADGLAVARVGDAPFAAAASRIDDLVTVTEAEIEHAIALAATQAGAVLEGAGAVALSAVLAGRISAQRVVVPFTGRNIDVAVHQRILAGHALGPSRHVLPDAA